MKVLMMIFAMLLSTASARSLKGHTCNQDYQSPNYWGKCVDGKYRNIETDSYGNERNCEALIILVPKDIVVNKTLTIETTLGHGNIARNFGLNEYGYYALMITQYGGYAPDIDIAFYLDEIMVHTGNYQQNFCFLESGSITTNDPNAVTYEGDYLDGMPGHVIIRF